MHLLKYVHLANAVRVGNNEKTYFTQTPDPVSSCPIAYDIYLYKNGMIKIEGTKNEGWTTLNNVKGFEPFSSKELEIFADGQQEKEPKQEEEETSGNNREMGREEPDQERSAEESFKKYQKEFQIKANQSGKTASTQKEVQQNNPKQSRPSGGGKRTSAKKAKGK